MRKNYFLSFFQFSQKSIKAFMIVIIFVVLSISFFANKANAQLLNEPFATSMGTWTAVAGSGDVVSVVATALAGGTADEVSIVGNSMSTSITDRLYSPAVNTTGMTSLTLTWNNYLDWYSSSYNYSAYVQTSTDGVTWHNTTWVLSPVTVDLGPGLQTLVISNSDVGSATFRVAFTVIGLTFGMNAWYIDNVHLVSNCIAPTTTYSVTGGGCNSSDIGLSNSQTGVSYQLYNGATAVGSPVAGTGSTISFGTQSTAGTYTVQTTATGGYCVATMTGSATIFTAVPSQPSTITGATNPASGTSQTYSVTNVAGTSYAWSFPSGWTQTAGGTTNSVTVTVGPTSGTISVIPSNTCGSGTAQTLSVCTATITGTTPASICLSGTVSLGAAASTGATINWYAALTGGTSLGTGTSFITPSISTTTTYYVDATDPIATCTSTARTSVIATVNNVPAQPSTITGSATPTIGASQTYSVTNVTGTTYTWTFPSGWTQTAGGTTNSITVTVGSGSGTITVLPSNLCGNGTAQTLTVCVAAVTGTTPAYICGTGTVTLGATGSPNTTLNWYALLTGGTSLGTGVTFTTPSISSTTTYYVDATDNTTSCISTPRTAVIATINNVPAQPSTITGSATPISGTSQTYSVTNVTGVTYNWTFPFDWNQTAGTTTSSVTATIGTQSGSVTVTPSNVCGNGTARALTVTSSLTLSSATSGTWICPAGVTSANVKCWGAGGGGGSRTSGTATSYGGGGGGAYATNTITGLVPGTSYSFTVGAGGAATATGGSTIFNTSSVIAVGGAGVAANSITGAAGGLASACTPTAGAYSGGTGGTGTASSFSGGGGGGAGSTGAGGNATGSTAGTGTSLNGGAGGAGRATNGTGNAGTNYGGGGGGAYRTTGSPVGGAGAGGYIVITTIVNTTAMISTGTLTGFGSVCVNATSGPNSFTITGYNLTSANITVAALAGYTYSTTSGGTYTNTLSLTQAGGNYSQIIYVKFNPTAASSYSGNIVVGGGGVATPLNVAATGTGVNTTPTVTTPTSASITTTTATLGGNITAIGCSAPIERGIYYSTTNGFANGTGTKVSETPGPYTTGVFTEAVTGLSPATIYYYVAFATNSGGTAYSAQGSFTTTCATALAGNYTIGATGSDFSSITAAVSSLNNCGISSPVVFQLIDANYSTSETFPIIFNAISGASATNTITFKPAAGITSTITGSSAVAILKLNGTDYLTIDGSNSGGTDQHLTISNTNTGTSSAIIWINSILSPLDSANNNVIKNTIITGNASTTTFAGIVSSSGTTIGAVADAKNCNNLFQNNLVTATYYGIALVGATANDISNSIINNTIGSTIAAGKIGLNSIFITQQQGVNVSGNTILGITNSTASAITTAGIYVGGTISGGIISANKISDIKSTVNRQAYGLELNSGSTSTGLTISNNMIFDIYNLGTNATLARNGHGIAIILGGGYNIYYNTVALNTTNSGTTATGIIAALYIASGVTALDIRNNIFTNTQTLGTRYAIYSAAANTAFSYLDYNDYTSTGTAIGYLGSALTNIAALRTATGKDVNSISASPAFVSATDLHLLSSSPTYSVGVAITGVTTDIDGQTRKTTPDIGADEIFVPTITTAGITTTLCFSSNQQSTTLAYSASNNTPNSYTIDWNAAANTAGLTDQSLTTYTFIPEGGIINGINVPASLPPATYNGTMIISNAYGYTSNVSISLKINALPSVTLTTQPGATICATTLATYTTQTGMTNYQWGFTGVQGADYTITSGSTDANSNSVTLQYLTAGSFNVNINYTNSNGCTAVSATQSTSTVTLPTDFAFTGSISPAINPACVSTTLAYSDPSSTIYWETALNGTSTTNPTTTAYTVSTTGTYYVREFNGTCWSNNSITSDLITIYPLYITFTSQPGASVCAYTDVTYKTQSGMNNYVWGIKGILNTDYVITAGGTSTDSTITLHYLNESIDTVSVNYTNSDGCTGASPKLSAPLIVHGLPVNPSGTITPAVNPACVNTNLTYSDASSTNYWETALNGTSTTLPTTTPYHVTTSGTYYVRAYSGYCWSPNSVSSDAITINQLPAIGAIGGGAASVCLNGTTPAFTDTTAGGVWSITPGTGTASITQDGIATGLTAGTATVVYTYFDGNCSNTASKSLIINQLPVGGNATATATNFCAGIGTTITLSAYNGTIQWQQSSDGITGWTNVSGGNGATSTIYTTPILTTTTYYMAVLSSGVCATVNSTVATVSVNPLPSPVVVDSSGTYCESTALSATGGTGGTIYWESTLATGTYTQQPSNFQIITASGTYYFRARTALGCWGAPSSAIVVINAPPVGGTATATAPTLCYGIGDTIKLTGNTGNTIQWQQSADGSTGWANVIGGSGATTATYITPVPLPATTYYRAISSSLTCPSDNSSTAMVTFVNNITSTTPGTRCGIGIDTLKATASSGTLKWYAAATGGTSLASGSPYTPTVSSTTTYYVAAETGNYASGNITIGIGASTSTGYESPFYYLYGGMKAQHLITAAELTAAGLSAGNITALSLNVVTTSTSFAGFVLSIDNTSLSALTTTLQTVSNTVFSGTITPTVGTYTINFTTPFAWNGTSNIIVQTCWSNNTTGGTGTTVKYDATTYAANSYYRADSQTPDVICSSTTATGILNTRPQMTFSGQIGSSCNSPRVPVVATVSPSSALTITANQSVCQNTITSMSVTSNLTDYNSYIWSPTTGLYTNAAATTAYNGTSATTVYLKSAIIDTITYTCTATNSTSMCANVATSTVIANPIPTSVTATASSSTICQGNSVNLTSSGVSNSPNVGSVAYTEGFETYPPTGWTYINAGTGNQWATNTSYYHGGSHGMSYTYNSTNAANAWAITQGLTLGAGTTYTISFWYEAPYGTSYTEKLKVTVGNAATVAGQTTTLYTNATITNTTWAQASFTYTPTTTGTYYFGFNCYSALNMDVLVVDDISITGSSLAPATFAWTSTPAGYTSAVQNPTGVAPSVNTKYTVTASNTYGCTASANTATINLNPPSVGGTATVTATNVCTGTGTTITLAGNTGTIQWQQSANGTSGWANVTGGSGATTATYTTPNLTATTYYRAVATSGVCTSANSTTAIVTVNTISEGGLAMVVPDICYNSEVTIFLQTSPDNFGAIQWQQSANGSTGWTNVTVGSGANTSFYTIPNLTIPTYYRAVVTNGACPSAFSSTAFVTYPSPTAQPTDILLAAGPTTINGSFTPSVSADHYLVVRSTSSTLTAAPLNGTTYDAFDQFGGGVVSAFQTGTTISDAGLFSNTQYYYFVFAAITQCLGGPASPVYLAVSPLTGSTTTTAPIVLNKTLMVTAMFQEYFNSSTGLMNQTLGINWDTGDLFKNFSGTTVDTVMVLIRKTNVTDIDEPCTIDTAFYGVNLNNNGLITISLSAAITGYHYIEIKHRNSIETWSDSVDFSTDTVKYDFYNYISQFALDNGMLQDGTHAWIWGGDVNQNGNLESEDATIIYVAANSDDPTVNNGYVICDIDGNGNLDSQDYGLSYNNANLGANVINPFSYLKKK